MTSDVERKLWDAISGGQEPREAIRRLIDSGAVKSAKQALATLEKWATEGVYEYGVALDLGWTVGGPPKRLVQVIGEAI